MDGMVSSEDVLMRTLGVERMRRNKKKRTRGNDHRFFGCCRGSADCKQGSWRWWTLEASQTIARRFGSGPMTTPSMRSDEQRRGGCHCSRCLGAYQREEKGKSVEEVQSRETSGGTLAENCFMAENSASDRRVIANLEKELQITFKFADGEGEPANSI